MSLINKMLQDLEERHSSEAGVAGTIHHQVRATPGLPRIHVAWWVALALALALTAVVSWLWGRQTAPVVIQPALALKLAPDLNVAQPPLPKAVVVEEKSALAAASATLPVADAKETEAKAVSPAPLNEAAQAAAAAAPAPAPATVAASIPASAPKPAAAAASIPVAAPAPAQTKPAVPAKRAASTAAQTHKDASFDAGLPVSKQMKEFTPQQRAENEYRKAVGLMQQGRATEAITVLEQVLQIDPQQAVARQTLVGLLLEGKRQDEAVRRLQEGLNLDPSQAGIAMTLARLQLDKGELRPAIQTLQRTLPYAVERADYQAFLAALLQRDGRHKNSIEHYSQALRKTPQNGVWWMGLGISLQAESRLTEARDALLRAKAANTLTPELLAFVEQKLAQLPH